MAAVRLRRVLTVLVSAAAIVVGFDMVLVAPSLGDCGAFGGRCPREAPPLLEDDPCWSSAAGAFIAAAVPTFLRAPSWRRLPIATGIGIAVAIVVGAVVASTANG